ncbi:hypothetical protein K469DRAFT_737413 [Zopfia rhizophila CBS 207.26]|uniref:Uncharacterized protein n=1 Tax=Zopfia rhizophila CBS 207.26 TaxID=1314779 RepID=A0A6A6EC52_9PEZI|nr:hypothetical protein K469DRAFT_737413 [Zopfia rhizophila CBS 207.26]
MRSSLAIVAATSLAGLTSAYPYFQKNQATCKPFSGNFSIQQYQLYPENADFDYTNCVLYIGQLWNASLGIYDPYTEKHEIIEFPGISHNSSFHLGGVGVDQATGHITFIADAGNTFNTMGEDISGTNWLFHMDPRNRTILYKVNLTETSQGLYGGFQDVEHDPDGNVFVVGTFPSSVLRVQKGGKDVRKWYINEPVDHKIKGMGGLAAIGWTLIAQGDTSGKLWRFDMRAEKGTPTVIPVTGNHTFGASDAIYLPRKYNGTVLLVAEDEIGTSVFRSMDEWKTAEFKGLVPWNDPRGLVTGAVQVGDGVYTILEPFGDEGVKGPGTAGSRSEFLFRDISKEVDVLLAA